MRRPAHPLSWIFATPLTDSVERQQARLLQVFLLALIGATVCSAPIFLLLEDHATSRVILITQTVVVLWSLWALVAIHNGYLYRSIELASAGLLGGLTILVVYLGLPQSDAFLIAFAFPLSMAGLLGTRRCLLTIAVSSSLLVLLTPVLHPLVHSNPVVLGDGTFTMYSLITFPAVTIGVTLFLDRAGMVLRTALNASLGRERELQRMRQALEQEIQHRQQLQNQLLHAQKMESIGRLAGGIAHDFNNLLAVILTCTQLVQRDLDLVREVQEDLSEIEHAARRAAGLTRQLLSFAQQQPLIWERIQLNNLVGEIKSLLQRMVPETITLQHALASDLDDIRGDVGQIEQVLMNLVANARDAMPEGGTLTIATEQVVINHDAAIQHGKLRPGSYITLSVHDTGHGMDQDTQDKIFEPFFTTKEEGKGTGLGLATTYGIVQGHGGTIECESAINSGTTFTIYLPQWEEGGEDTT